MNAEEKLKNIGLTETQKVSVTDEIVKQIRHLIKSGELNPGDKLPSQREMELIFHVSRPTLRAAISKLIALDVIDAKQGKGYYVKQTENHIISLNIPSAILMNRDEVYELYEAKMFFDAILAHLAAYNATDDEIAQLMKYVNSLGEDAPSDEELGLSGNQFHKMVADCTHNKILAEFENSLQTLLQEYERSFFKKDPNMFDQYELIPHRKIAEAISCRDGYRAYKAAFDHVMSYMLSIGFQPQFASEKGNEDSKRQKHKYTDKI